MKSTRWVLSYVVAASVGLWLAFFLSLKFVVPAYSQAKPEAPSSGDLPPEFAKEAPKQLSPGAIPPPPSQPPTVEGSSSATAPMPMAPVEAPQILQVPQFASDDQYIYDPTGRRDPFKPYRIFKPAPVGAGPRVADMSDPLQRWELSRFDVVAIMWEIRNPRAMVKDPDGRLYPIAKATKIGRNSGQVVAIREGEVVGVEVIENEGIVAKEVKVLELKK